jgi:hypothetical protein
MAEQEISYSPRRNSVSAYREIKKFDTILPPNNNDEEVSKVKFVTFSRVDDLSTLLPMIDWFGSQKLCQSERSRGPFDSAQGDYGPTSEPVFRDLLIMVFKKSKVKAGFF